MVLTSVYQNFLTKLSKLLAVFFSLILKLITQVLEEIGSGEISQEY